jgi:hypothetical protein
VAKAAAAMQAQKSIFIKYNFEISDESRAWGIIAWCWA